MIEVSAPGKKTWQTSVAVSGERGNFVVTVPALEDAPLATVATATTGEAASTGAKGPERAAGSARRTLAFIVGGAGVIGLGVGAGFAISAKSKYDESLHSCGSDDKNFCREPGFSLREDARAAGTVATIAVGLGAVALATGVVLLLTAPSSEGAHVALAPGPGGAGLSLVGSY